MLRSRILKAGNKGLCKLCNNHSKPDGSNVFVTERFSGKQRTDRVNSLKTVFMI